ncbi:hypothetical protein UU7_15865 [Rhodanobacter spathiphylli B39]|uniref:CopL family metal-binding regulatory protein n=2 Tax=Rhodanobacter TaxID=75309 RepID=I4VSE6_9GAMM|nr:hypothetical protein UU7_15865 [Rhodanobacter spathiphylli B39]
MARYHRAMSCASSPLLARLRRHRGLWTLALAVMLIKLATGTICLADGPELRSASTAAAEVPALVATMAEASAHDDASHCVLGEAGGCHCTCAHAVTLPMTAWLPTGTMDARFVAPAISPQHMPALAGSLIRPPIA